MVSEKRRAARVSTDVSVTIRWGTQQESSHHVQNISMGGLFISTHHILDLETSVELEFQLPNGQRPIQCRGEVIWNSTSHPERAGGQPGIGVRLLSLGFSDLRSLEKFIGGALAPKS